MIPPQRRAAWAVVLMLLVLPCSVASDDPKELSDPAKTTNTTNTSVPLDPSSILGMAGPDELQACIMSKCIAQALACGGDTECGGYAGLLAKVPTMPFSEKLKLLTQLSLAAKNNPTIHALMTCMDKKCGACTVSQCPANGLLPAEPVTKPAAPVAKPSGETEPMPPQGEETASSAKGGSIAALPSALLLSALGHGQWE